MDIEELEQEIEDTGAVSDLQAAWDCVREVEHKIRGLDRASSTNMLYSSFGSCGFGGGLSQLNRANALRRTLYGDDGVYPKMEALQEAADAAAPPEPTGL